LSRLLELSNGLREYTINGPLNLGIFIFICRDTLFSTWKTDNKVAGYKKSVGNYELRTVNNAGHLIPMDQGAAARQMLKEFIDKSKNWKSEDLKMQ
jgi:hypothetical protein